MKKSSLLGYLGFALAMGATADEYPITERGKVAKSDEPKTPPKEPTPFNKQDGIVRMIADYKLIKAGQSKKGKAKQSRILNRIQEFLDSGQLTKKDLQ